MREAGEVREYLLALVRGSHGMIGRLKNEDGDVAYTTLIGDLIAWSLNYAVDVMDGCQIGFDKDSLDDAIDWIVQGALRDSLGRDRDGR